MYRILPVIIMALLLSCSSEQKSSQQEVEQTQVQDTLIDSVAFTKLNRDTKSSCSGGTENEFTYNGVFPSPTPDAELNKLVANTVVENIKNSFMIDNQVDLSHVDSLHEFNPLIDQWTKAFLRDACEAQNGFDMAMSWELEVQNGVERNSNGVLTLYFSQYSFTGGAHGNSSMQYVNIDTRTSSVIDIEAVIQDSAKFVKLGDQKLRKFLEIDDQTPYTEAGLNMDEFPMTNNFGFTEEGVVLFYNAYEIGPYSLGTVELTFTYDELNGIIDAQYSPQKPEA